MTVWKLLKLRDLRHSELSSPGLANAHGSTQRGQSLSGIHPRRALRVSSWRVSIAPARLPAFRGLAEARIRLFGSVNCSPFFVCHP